MEINRPAYFFLNLRVVFYGLWILLGVMQAALTELQDDEAYYWVFSKYPDWGYFDHPPLIAILIKAGYALFPNELGVRLFPFVLHLLTLFTLEKLTKDQPRNLFYLIILSIAALQLTGFMAVPDTPLLFSTAIFFLCYKWLLEKRDFTTSVLLGLSCALLMYSKYHGALVILFTIVSNPRLFLNYRIYVAGLVALVIFLPHLLWQYEHQWVSFRYHLLESNVNVYRLSYTLSYLTGQFLLAGPIAGVILLPAAILYRSRDELDRALKFTLLGVYLFFLLSSFRGKVEMNWTAPVLIPLVILSCKFLAGHPRWFKLLRVLVPVSILLVMAARILMVADLAPIDAIRKKYHAWKDWPSEMKAKTGGSPVVFSNSYQRASKYWFYSGQLTYSQNLYKEHRNQYNYWPVEDSILGDTVHYLDIYDLHRFRDTTLTPMGIIGYKFDPEFTSLARVQLQPSKKTYEVRNGDSLSVISEIVMPVSHRNYLEQKKRHTCRLVIAVFAGNKWLKDIPASIRFGDLLAPRIVVKFLPNLKKGKYQLLLALQNDGYHPTHNSERFTLIVK
jgi:hypothetical protein